MDRARGVSILFWIAGGYDAVLALIVLGWAEQVYAHFDVVPPNHWGYVYFPAGLVLTFGLMFFAIAAGPQRNRNLIPYGILFKVSYCAVVFSYWAVDRIPDLWKPFAVADLLMIPAFAWAWVRLGKA